MIYSVHFSSQFEIKQVRQNLSIIPRKSRMRNRGWMAPIQFTILSKIFHIGINKLLSKFISGLSLITLVCWKCCMEWNVKHSLASHFFLNLTTSHPRVRDWVLRPRHLSAMLGFLWLNLWGYFKRPNELHKAYAPTWKCLNFFCYHKLHLDTFVVSRETSIYRGYLIKNAIRNIIIAYKRW